MFPTPHHPSSTRFIRLRLALFGCCLLLASACGGSAETERQRYLESGDRYLAADKLPEALLEYQNAVRVDPASGVARLKLGEAFLQAQEPSKAIVELVRAADLLPQDASAQVKAGALWLLIGKFDDARSYADRALVLAPAHQGALVLRANALAGLKNLGDAIEQMEEAIDLDPTTAELYSNLGSLRARTGQLDEAEASFERAIEVGPNSDEAHAALGNFYLATGRLRSAELQFRKAVEIRPQNVVAHRALATLYVAAGRPTEATPHLKAVADLLEDAKSRLDLADFYLVNGQTDAGLALLAEIGSNAGGYYAARTRVAAFEYARGRREEAHRIVDEVIARGRYAEGWLLKAQFLAREGQLTSALDRARQAVAITAEYVPAHYLIGRLSLALGDPRQATEAFERVLQLNPRAAAAQTQLARLQLARGNPDLSVEYAERAVRTAPEDATARLVLVRSLIQLGRTARAESELAILRKRFPAASPVLALAGTLAALKKDYRGARTAFEAALSGDERNLDAISGLIGLDVMENRPQAARARIDAELARSPKSVPVLLLAARTHAALRDMAAAEKHLRAAVDADPVNPETYAVLGHFYYQQNRLEEGRKEFAGLVERDPKSVPAQTMLGIILRQQDRTDDAIKAYRAALAIDSQAAVAANNLAWIYADRGENLDEGLILARMARLRMPGQAEVADTIGWLHYKARSPKLALPYLEEALQKDPLNPLYHFHLGAAHARIGDTVAARESLKKSLSLGRDFPGADEARRLLARLR